MINASIIPKRLRDKCGTIRILTGLDAPALLRRERLVVKRTTSPNARRWRSPQVPNVGVMANTRSEAKAWFARYLGLKKLPSDFEIVSY